VSDWLYRFARALFDQTIHLYYGRIEVTGRENIPREGAVILVANHPNAVADACLIGTQITPRRVSFVAKDTVTRAPVLGWLARSIGVIGVARPMEYGQDSDLAKERNRLAIEACVPRLKSGEVIAIFGEGISTDVRHLHQVRKGAMRFGYAAEMAAGFGLNLAWVPIGINYPAKQRFRSDVLIRVGPPFRVRDLHSEPATSEAEVLEIGTERLQRELRSLVVNIEKGELVGLIDRLAVVCGPPESPLEASVERHQRVALAVEYFNEVAPRRVADLEGALRRYDRGLSESGLSDEIVRHRHPSLALWVSLRGLAAHGTLLLLNGYGWINSIVPRWTSYFLGRIGRAIEATADRDEMRRAPLVQQVTWSTFGGLLGAALAFPLQIYVVFRWAASGRGTSAGAAAAAIYAATLLPSWRLYVRRRDLFRRHLVRVRSAFRFMRHARAATRLRAERSRIGQRVRTLLADYEAGGSRAA
jgi:1-acyl-sn-glycerol-3-phosphate acyltransferase